MVEEIWLQQILANIITYWLAYSLPTIVYMTYGGCLLALWRGGVANGCEERAAERTMNNKV